MKKFLKKLLIVIGTLVGIIILLLAGLIIYFKTSTHNVYKESAKLVGPETKTITIDGFTFRDLNKNGKLDVYEDVRKPIDDRVNDLVAQMTLEEKAGTMFITMLGICKDGSMAEEFHVTDISSYMGFGTTEMLFLKNMNHFNILLGLDARKMAEWYNNIQKMAEKTRLGIPVTFASDPRNHYFTNALAAGLTGDMTSFPQPLGLAAMDDSAAMAEFADIARQEYLALGIRVALHPQIDLATEPRWSRISGTFGEDAALTSKLTYAYIKGFQTDTMGINSVACMTKHFPGGGPQKEGLDPHFAIQRGQVYPGNNFNYHLLPFEAAFKAGTAEIMPYYGVPMGQGVEEVGFSFNKEIITGLLREKYHFNGIVCTDWGLVSDARLMGYTIMDARAWGMEKATREERVLKIIEAGVDQFGGEACPEIIVKLVKDGKIKMERIDESVKRLIRMKFTMGLFDHPFVDVENSVEIVGNEKFKVIAAKDHRKSIVLLKNDSLNNSAVLPLKKGIKIFIKNVDPIIAARYGTIVEKPEEADFAIIRLISPDEKLPGTGIIGNMLKGGDLEFKEKDKKEIMDLLTKVPTIVDITLNRPAVMPEIAGACKGLMVSFSSPDDAVLDVIFGNFNPQGKLPIEIPSSMEAVKNQKEDLPYDSENPLYKFGFGLNYKKVKQ
ncbi:MAG: glycoside hydrolase family 3 N-terminal domain-containing protein [Bacteroidales bacterium]